MLGLPASCAHSGAGCIKQQTSAMLVRCTAASFAPCCLACESVFWLVCRRSYTVSQTSDVKQDCKPGHCCAVDSMAAPTWASVETAHACRMHRLCSDTQSADDGWLLSMYGCAVVASGCSCTWVLASTGQIKPGLHLVHVAVMHRAGMLIRQQSVRRCYCAKRLVCTTMCVVRSVKWLMLQLHPWAQLRAPKAF